MPAVRPARTPSLGGALDDCASLGRNLFARVPRAGPHEHSHRRGLWLKSEPRPPVGGGQDQKRLPLSELTVYALLAALEVFGTLGRVPEIKGYDHDTAARSALAVVNAI